jgi:hypothetical protein
MKETQPGGRHQLVGTIKANGWSEETAAGQVDLPIEAIREVLRFAEQEPELLAFETAFENWLLECRGAGRDSRPVLDDCAFAHERHPRG